MFPLFVNYNIKKKYSSKICVGHRSPCFLIKLFRQNLYFLPNLKQLLPGSSPASTLHCYRKRFINFPLHNNQKTLFVSKHFLNVMILDQTWCEFSAVVLFSVFYKIINFTNYVIYALCMQHIISIFDICKNSIFFEKIISISTGCLIRFYISFQTKNNKNLFFIQVIHIQTKSQNANFPFFFSSSNKSNNLFGLKCHNLVVSSIK